MQKDFNASHPVDMTTFTADIQPDGSWNILNIQSTEAGGQVLETQNVTKCAAMICNPKLCNVLCSSCSHWPARLFPRVHFTRGLWVLTRFAPVAEL